MAKWFSVVVIWLRGDWWNGYRLGSFLLLQLFLQLGDMFISECFLQVLWSHTSILILHFLCEHLYPGTQLVNHLPQLTDSLITIKCINYSESQKSVLRQETIVLPADFVTMLQM